MMFRFSVLLLTIGLSPCAALADESQPDAPSLYIEGYADQLSYQAGDKVRLHVSTSAPKWSLEVARIGAKTETVLNKNDIPGAAYDVPVNASSHGCRWPVGIELEVPDDWRSGYYEAMLRASDNGGQFVGRGRRTAEAKLFFVVRPAMPGSNTKILLQLTTNTYNAYNNWGGHSLYAFHARNKLQGTRVSFDRPLAGFFRQWELPFVAWAERQGYVLDYAVNSDLEFRPDMLKHYKLVLSVGHDEYWSSHMRDHLEAFIGEGGNVAFFSGNTCCWQVRSEEAGRALVCYKQALVLDPVFAAKDHRLLATLWSHHLLARPENTLTGVGFLYGGYHRSHGQFMESEAAFTVHQPDHWLFSGTSLKQGDKFGGKNT
ncbi:MAG TPA: N,N-dimethylformamidase beta subunit family domain-containing protein, partial [Pirellulales bacterium]|nr:N,N-dimethylformamidase beta subunit family domain-containing protein [Pirellulales bacterium]